MGTKLFLGLCAVALVSGALGAGIPTVHTGESYQYRNQDDAGNYAFGYEESHATGSSFRKEQADSQGRVTGSYGLQDADGRVRIVNYVADENGFRADIKTNEPGVDDTQDPANADINKHNHPPLPNDPHVHQHPASTKPAVPVETTTTSQPTVETKNHPSNHDQHTHNHPGFKHAIPIASSSPYHTHYDAKTGLYQVHSDNKHKDISVSSPLYHTHYDPKTNTYRIHLDSNQSIPITSQPSTHTHYNPKTGTYRVHLDSDKGTPTNSHTHYDPKTGSYRVHTDSRQTLPMSAPPPYHTHYNPNTASYSVHTDPKQSSPITSSPYYHTHYDPKTNSYRVHYQRHNSPNEYYDGVFLGSEFGYLNNGHIHRYPGDYVPGRRYYKHGNHYDSSDNIPELYYRPSTYRYIPSKSN